MKHVSGAPLALLALIWGIVPAWSQVTYENIAPAVRVDQSYGNNGFGGGVSFYDFDNDGWDDLSFATQTGTALAFFRNVDGLEFERVNPPFVPHFGMAEQLLWVDIDNDGDEDLFVSAYMTGNRLYRNDSTLGFTDITAIAGLPTANMPSYAACWGDYDRDGWIDLYLTNRTEPAHLYYNYLFRNKGDGTFEDVTAASGTADPGKQPLAVMFVDINNDLWPDLYIAQDKFAGNTLLRNNGNGTFTDISAASGSNSIVDGMGITAGDYDGDGYLDLYFSNSPLDGNMLLRNNGDETFTDVSAFAGVAHNGSCWGVNFLDYDNDGDLDLYSSSVWFSFFNNPASRFFVNQGNGAFSTASGLGFAGDSALSFSNAIGDFDRDGHPEIAVNNILPYKFHLWKNSGNSGNHWLKVRLRGVQSNRNGIGSFVETYTQGIRQIRYTNCGTSYLAQNSAWEMFGLGGATTVDSLIIRWPSGLVDRFFQVAADQHLDLVEGSGETAPITHIDGQLPAASWSIGPNPVDGEGRFALRIHAATPMRCSLEIRDMTGRCVFQESFSVAPGNETHELAAGHLPPGVYQVVLRSDNKPAIAQKLLIR